jgi:hypothetical protein
MLEESRKTAEQTRAGLLSYLCDVVEAYFALDEGDVERAVVLLREAFAFGSAKGIYNFFWFRKDIMSRLCALAIQYSLFTTYAQDLARHHNLVPDSACPGQRSSGTGAVALAGKALHPGTFRAGCERKEGEVHR